MAGDWTWTLIPACQYVWSVLRCLSYQCKDTLSSSARVLFYDAQSSLCELSSILRILAVCFHCDCVHISSWFVFSNFKTPSHGIISGFWIFWIFLRAVAWLPSLTGLGFSSFYFGSASLVRIKFTWAVSSLILLLTEIKSSAKQMKVSGSTSCIFQPLRSSVSSSGWVTCRAYPQWWHVCTGS